MPHRRWQSFMLCIIAVLFGTIVSGCDSTVAPDIEPRMVNTVEERQSCFDSPQYGQATCPGIETFCYRADGTQTSCTGGPLEPTDVEMCIDPATGEQYPCPPQAERLVFSGTDELESYLSTLDGASDDQLAAAEQQRGLTQSLRAYLDNGEGTEWGAREWSFTDGPTGNEATALENDGVVRADFPVSDVFLSLLNSDGEIQIGDTIYKVTRDNVYAVTPENLGVLNQAVPTLSSPAPAPDSRISVTPVETTAGTTEEGPLTSVAVAPGGPSYHHISGAGKDCYVYLGDTRLHGRSDISNFVFYTEAYVVTEWQRKKKFLGITFWSNTWQSGTLSHKYDGQLSFRRRWFGSWSYVGPGLGSLPGPAVGARIYHRLQWGTGLGTRIRGTIHSEHFVSTNPIGCLTAASA